MDNSQEPMRIGRRDDTGGPLAAIPGRNLGRETDTDHQDAAPTGAMDRARDSEHVRPVPADRVAKAKGHWNYRPRYYDKPYSPDRPRPISPELRAFYADEKRKAEQRALTRRLRCRF